MTISGATEARGPAASIRLSRPMRVLAPAKINLHLRVGKRRDDGFHPLLTWMCTVGLFDKLIVERARTESAPISLTCNRADVPTDQSNLVLKAAAGLAPLAARPDQLTAGLSLHLEKHVPHGAGLGGGSSDATRTLLALNAFLKLDLGKGQLEAVAARLGSDLSFFFHEPSALCRGRGELVEPIAPPLPRWGLLVMPGTHMPTPAVYRKFDELGLGDDDVEREPVDPNQWCNASSLELLARLRNDLEQPAFAIDPKLGDLRKEIEQLLARTVRMSGSGSSLFTLFDQEQEARQAASVASSKFQIHAIPVELAPKIRDDLHEDLAKRY